MGRQSYEVPAPSDAPCPLPPVEGVETGSMVWVGGWRAWGWVTHHLAGHDRTLRVSLAGSVTLADGVYVLGHALACGRPGRASSVGAELAGFAHVAIDARYATLSLVEHLVQTLMVQAPNTSWWIAIAQEPDRPGVVAGPEPTPALDEGIPPFMEIAAWLPESPRAGTELPLAMCQPDGPRHALRADAVTQIRAQPARSIASAADLAVGGHSDLFPIATGGGNRRCDPVSLFGLRFIAESASDPNVACLAGAAAARVRLQIGQGAEALQRLEQTLSRVHHADPAHRALLLWAEALVFLEMGDWAVASARFEEASEAVHQGRDLYLLATMNRQWAERLVTRGHLQSASEHLRAARGLYRRLGDRDGLSATLRCAGDLAVALGELVSAEALYEQAEMTTTTDLEQSNRVAGLVGLAVASRAWERAQAQIRRLRRMKIDHRVHDANVRRREADLALRSGDWVSAARLGQEAAGIYEHAGEPSAAARALRLSGDAEALQGQVHAAMALFRRAAEEQFRLGDWSSLRVTLRHASALCSEDARQKLGKLSTELTLLGGAL